MRELDVGQRVKLTDRNSPHYGAMGRVTGFDPDWR
jgi:hypothetical protein